MSAFNSSPALELAVAIWKAGAQAWAGTASSIQVSGSPHTSLPVRTPWEGLSPTLGFLVYHRFKGWSREGSKATLELPCRMA